MPNSITKTERAGKRGKQENSPASRDALDAILRIVTEAIQDENAVAMFKLFCQGVVRFFSSQPVLRPGELHILSSIATALGVDETTIARWESIGLKPCRPGTKKKFVFSEDIFEVMRKDAAEIPAYQPRYKQKKKRKRE